MISQRLLPQIFAGALLVLAAVTTSIALAQNLPGEPSPDRGKALAQRVCAVCHIPQEGGPMLQGTADVPTFPEIARMEGQTAERITGAIILPSHPMPQIVLTKNQMADLASYILSLK